MNMWEFIDIYRVPLKQQIMGDYPDYNYQEEPLTDDDLEEWIMNVEDLRDLAMAEGVEL